MPRPPQELLEFARAHVRAEADRDVEATLATLDDDPSFELQPAGLGFGGRELVRRYYEWLVGPFRDRQRGAELRGEYVGAGGVVLEHVLRVEHDDGRVVAHPVVTVLLEGRRALAGERVYAERELLALMVGPVLAEAKPLA